MFCKHETRGFTRETWQANLACQGFMSLHDHNALTTGETNVGWG